MKNLIRIKFLMAVVMLLNGCRKDQWNDCFQGTGKDITVSRYLGPFTKISIGEKFDIILTQDTAQNEEVKITAGSHIIDQIVTKVKNNTLTIENKNTCNFVRSYERKIKIEIRVRFLDDIEIFSASNLRSPDTLHFEKSNYLNLKNNGLGDINLKLKLGYLEVHSINSGNIFLEGFVNILTCSIEEVTVFDARKMLCDDIYIDSHTPLDCYINPKNLLAAKIFNKGNIYYVTKPPKFELTEQRGKGQLLQL